MKTPDEQRGPTSTGGTIFAGSTLLRQAAIQQGSLIDTCCPFETWLFPPHTICKAIVRCIM